VTPTENKTCVANKMSHRDIEHRWNPHVSGLVRFLGFGEWKRADRRGRWSIMCWEKQRTTLVHLWILFNPCSVPLLSLSLSLSLNACTAESTDLSFSNPGSFCSFCVTSYNPLVSTKTEPFLNLLSNSNDPAKEFCDHAHNCNSAFVLPYVLNLKPSASFQNFGRPEP